MKRDDSTAHVQPEEAALLIGAAAQPEDIDWGAMTHEAESKYDRNGR